MSLSSKLTRFSKWITNLLSGFWPWSLQAKPKTLYERAKAYGTRVAKEANHKYAGKPYSYHYQLCEEFIQPYLMWIPVKYREAVLAAIWCHDAIEDHRQTYNDVKKHTSELVADLVYAVTNEKGRNRAERANGRYYNGIHKTPYADLVKHADRGGNLMHSMSHIRYLEQHPTAKQQKEASMYLMYKKEHPKYFDYLYKEKYRDIFLEFDAILRLHCVMDYERDKKEEMLRKNSIALKEPIAKLEKALDKEEKKKNEKTPESINLRSPRRKRKP